jgi:AcrR family transcriptional regulator
LNFAGDFNLSDDTVLQPSERSRKEERLKNILAAAFEEFTVSGFAATRLDTIAEGAGISKGTIYLYFQNKEQLFEEVVKAYISPVVDEVVQISEAPQGAAAAMLRVQLETIYKRAIATERRRIMRLLIGEGPRFPHLVDLYHREVISRVFGALKRTITYGVETGEFRETKLTVLPPLVMGPALGGMLWKVMFEERQPLDLDALCEAHIELLLGTLRKI